MKKIFFIAGLVLLLTAVHPVSILSAQTISPEVVGMKQSYETKEDGRIIVTLTFSEAVEGLPQGWYAGADNTWSKVFYKTKEVTVNFTDVDGNAGLYDFEVDKTAPEATSITQVYETKENGRIRVTLEFNEAVQGLPQGWYAGANNTWSKVFYKTQATTINFQDLVGNPATYTFEVDQTAPTLTIKEEEGYTAGDLERNIFSKVSFKLYDKHLIKEVEVNGKIMSLTANEWSDWNYVSVGNAGGVYGENTIIARDVTGNQTEFKFSLDNVAPKIELQGGANQGTGEESYTRKIVVTDDIAGVDQDSLKYIWTTSRLDNLPAIEAKLATNGISFLSGETITTPAGAGKYYLQAVAKDTLGNTSWCASWGFDVVSNFTVDSKVGSNLINLSTKTIYNFQSWAIKLNKDITPASVGGTKVSISYKYNVNGDGWVSDSFTKDITSSLVKEDGVAKYPTNSVIAAGSVIKYSETGKAPLFETTSVSYGMPNIYNAIVATTESGYVEVVSILKFVTPDGTYTVELDPITYSNGGNTVSHRGLPVF